ncbi:MAG: ChaN family lipoprotein [Myxococcota bacterium]
MPAIVKMVRARGGGVGIEPSSGTTMRRLEPTSLWIWMLPAVLYGCGSQRNAETASHRTPATTMTNAEDETTAIASSVASPGASSAASSAASPPWQGRLLLDHALVGRVYSMERGQASSPQELIGAVGAARFALLGERHDHPDHHRRQALIVREALAGKSTPAVAFEMFDRTEQSTIDEHFASRPGDAFGLGGAVGWERKGWPAWSMYAEIVQAAVDQGARVVAANLSRSEVMSAAKSGTFPWDGEPRPVPEMPADELEAMKEELYHAHCQHLPKAMMGAMATAQIARDATLASTMVAADRGDGTILITGNGHARKDRGVPWHLRNQGVEGTIVSVGFLEVREGLTEPAAYGQQGEPPPYDFVWFTPAWEREDPCATFQGKE